MRGIGGVLFDLWPESQLQFNVQPLGSSLSLLPTSSITLFYGKRIHFEMWQNPSPRLRNITACNKSLSDVRVYQGRQGRVTVFYAKGFRFVSMSGIYYAQGALGQLMQRSSIIVASEPAPFNQNVRPPTKRRRRKWKIQPFNVQNPSY